MVVERGTARYLKVSWGGRIIICPHRPVFESGADHRDDGALAGLGIFWISILEIEEEDGFLHVYNGLKKKALRH